MRRLLEDFERLFDLDYEIGGRKLPALIESAILELERHPAPDWGSAGPRGRVELAEHELVRFYYVPHLFPGMELKLRLAHKLQFHLLPRELPPDAPVSIAAVLESFCHMSGDLFGWQSLSGGKFLIWIVDLSGHGVRSGLASAILKVMIDNVTARDRVGELAAQLNDALAACVRTDGRSLFATGVFLVLDGEGGLRFTSAGHPAGLIRGADGRVRELVSNSRPIGMFSGQRYQEDEDRLEPGETLLLYTDGLLEMTGTDGGTFGAERLQEFLAGQDGAPESITRELYRACQAFQDMDKLDDDITFLVARAH